MRGCLWFRYVALQLRQVTPSAPKTVSVMGHLGSSTHPDRNDLALPHVPQKASGVWKLHCQYVFSFGILSAVGGHPHDFSDVAVEYYHISHIKKRTFLCL